MRKIANTAKMTRQEWLEARRAGIGGSDAAAIAGLNPYKTAIGVYLEKVNEVKDDETNEAAYWGNRLEQIVADEFIKRINEAEGTNKRTGYNARKNNFLLQHDEHYFMIANIDRELFHPKRGRGILECKTASNHLAKEWSGGNVPDHYFIQVQHYLAVTGYDYAYIAVLIGGNSFKYYEILPDQKLISELIEIEREFWENYVLTQTPPPMDGSDAAADLLKHLYPESKPQTIELPNEAETLIKNYEYWSEQESIAKANKQEAENKLKALLKDNEAGKFNTHIVEWKTVKQTRIDTKRLKEEAPDIFEKYAKIINSRRFAVKTMKL